MTDGEIELFWNLYEKMNREGRLKNPSHKYCQNCKKIYPTSSDHWRITSNGYLWCQHQYNKSKEKEYRKRYSDMSTFIMRKYGSIKQRCTNTNNPRFKKYQGRLNMRQDEFIDWANTTLPKFLKENDIIDIRKVGVELDRIDRDKGYELTNIQWLTTKQHQKKSSQESYKPVLQYTKSGKFIKRWDSASQANEWVNKKVTSPYGVFTCCLGYQKSIAGYRWFYESDKNRIEQFLKNKEKERKEFCKYCQSIIPLPNPGQSNDHWRWSSDKRYRSYTDTNGNSHRGTWRCKIKDRDSIQESRLKEKSNI
jgi:hypothetical protein